MQPLKLKTLKVGRKGNAFMTGAKNIFGNGLMIILVSVVALILAELNISVSDTDATWVINNGTFALQNFSGFTPVQGTILCIVVLLLVVGLIKFKFGGRE